MEIVDYNKIIALINEKHTLVANLDLSFWPLYTNKKKLSYDKFLDSILLGKSGLKVTIPGNKSSKLNLKYVTVKKPDKNPGHPIVRSLEIKMSYKVQNIEALAFNESEKTKEVKYITPKSFLQGIFEEEISLFILALTISSGGLLDILNISLKDNKKEFSNFFTHYPFQTDGELSWNSAIEYGWPKLKFIDFEKTLKWVRFFRQEIFSSASSRIGIALNAFTETLIDKKDLSSTLIWSMIALESLFVEERYNKAEQININSQILLGRRKSYLNKFKDLYKTRSELLHGDLPITGMFLKDDATPKASSVIYQQIDAGSFSLAITMAAFQTFITKDIKDYSFKNNIRFEPLS
ncbi:MAG: hypothetical protein KBH94_04670 [Caldisericia bacterium]|nr:hypothetical protein [Caldisericia bacterium]